MKRFSEQLHKKSETVKLRAAEKRALRERVVSYMEYHPLPAAAKTKRVFADRTELTEAYRVIHIPFSWIARVGASVAVLVFIIVPVMAERAVPGDSLYAVKVRFNEEVRSSLAFSTSEKVAWETERLNRRIAEARLLASEGKLTEEVEVEVAEAVRSHVTEAQRNIAILRNVDADEATLASIAFETTLEVQSASLRSDSEEMVGDEPVAVMMMAARSIEPVEADASSNALSLALQDSLGKSASASSSLPSFDKTMARVEQNTTRIFELLDSINGVMSAEQHIDVTRRTADIGRAIEEIVGLRNIDEEASKQRLVEVLQRTQRLIVYMTELAANNEIDIEDIVPIVLTPEEEAAGIAQFSNEVDGLIKQLDAVVIDEVDSDIVDKLDYTKQLLREYRAAIASSGQYLEVKALAESARAATEDTLSFFTVVPVEVEPELPDIMLGTSTPTTSTTTVDVASSTSDTASSTGQVDI